MLQSGGGGQRTLGRRKSGGHRRCPLEPAGGALQSVGEGRQQCGSSRNKTSKKIYQAQKSLQSWNVGRRRKIRHRLHVASKRRHTSGRNLVAEKWYDRLRPQTLCRINDQPKLA